VELMQRVVVVVRVASVVTATALEMVERVVSV
jgi:hypothetical protein